MSQKEQAKAEKPKKVKASKEAKAPPKAAEAPGKSPRKAGESTVFIGRKPVMNYVLACITFFHGGAKEVNVKARGRAISLAVDVVEVVRRRFLPDVKVKKIGIGTEQLAPREDGGSPTNVSSIEITLVH